MHCWSACRRRKVLTKRSVFCATKAPFRAVYPLFSWKNHCRYYVGILSVFRRCEFRFLGGLTERTQPVVNLSGTRNQTSDGNGDKHTVIPF